MWYLMYVLKVLLNMDTSNFQFISVLFTQSDSYCKIQVIENTSETKRYKDYWEMNSSCQPGLCKGYTHASSQLWLQ